MMSQNPALLDSTKAGDAVLLLNPFFADINAYTFQYQPNISSLGRVAFGLSYIHYGNFVQRDDTGLESGQFNANDLVFTVGKSHRMGPFVMGANLKYIHTGIASYTANAVAMDLGGTFQPRSGGPTFGLAIRNLGAVLSDFTENNSTLPLEVALGTSFKPEGMPIRFSITGHHFVDDDDEFYETDENPNFADQILKRLSIGGELLLSKNVNFLIGYDHNRKRELQLEQTAGGAGFSYGFMINFKRYRFRFSRACGILK